MRDYAIRTYFQAVAERPNLLTVNEVMEKLEFSYSAGHISR